MLKDLIERRGITPCKAAKEAGLAKQTVYNMLKEPDLGKYQYNNLKRLADVLSITPEELIQANREEVQS